MSRSEPPLSVPWHSSAVEIADHNFKIITGKLSKLIINKSLTQLSLGVPKDFFLVVGYHTHNLEGNVPKPKSIVTPSPVERTSDDQPFIQFPGTLTILEYELIFLQCV